MRITALIDKYNYFCYNITIASSVARTTKLHQKGTQMAKDRRGSGRSTWRIVIKTAEAGATIALLAVLIFAVWQQFHDEPRQIGQCVFQPASPRGVVATIRGAVVAMGLHPGKVEGIHDAAIKSGVRDLSAGQTVQVCLTPDNKMIASVNGVNAGG